MAHPAILRSMSLRMACCQPTVRLQISSPCVLGFPVCRAPILVQQCPPFRVQLLPLHTFPSPLPQAWSSVRSFYTLPPASSPFPLSLAIIADVATSVYTAANIDNMLLLDPDVVLLAGDLPYADLYQGGKGGVVLGEVGVQSFISPLSSILAAGILSPS